MEGNLKTAPKILVVGSINMDLIVSSDRFPESGETVLGQSYQTAPGGKGANQAVQAARLGASVTMVGKVGYDSFGDALIKSLQDSGVDTSYVFRSSSCSTGFSNIQLEKGSKHSANRIVVIPGANYDLQPSDVSFLENEIKQYDIVLLQLEIPMEINALVASYAAAKDVPVMLNCAPVAPMTRDLLEKVTYLSPNEHEARILTGIEITDDTSIVKAMQEIHNLGVKNALITLGSRGVAYESDSGILYSPALTGLKVQDTTAAGDSFVGAFCTAISSGASISESLAFANHVAALTVCKMGAQPSLPTLNEVIELMKDRNTHLQFLGE